MYADEIYGFGGENERQNEWFKVVGPNETESEGTINFDSAYLYYTLQDGKYVLVNSGDDDKTNDGRLDEFDSAYTYYTRGKAKGIWYLLLYSAEDGGEKKEIAYTVNNMGDMMSAAVTNLKNSTLNDFADAKVIESNNLNSYVPLRKAEEGETEGVIELFISVGSTKVSLGKFVCKQIKDCTIDEMLTAVNTLLGLLEPIA